MGLATKFAAELEQLSEQTRTKKLPVSARVDADLVDQLHDGSVATGATESKIVEACLKHSLDAVIRMLLEERDIAAARFRIERKGSPSATVHTVKAKQKEKAK